MNKLVCWVIFDSVQAALLSVRLLICRKKSNNVTSHVSNQSGFETKDSNL